jgi:hypothetical protein
VSATHTPDSFWARVGIRGPDDCWPFLGAITRGGYGTCAWNGRTYQAHRLAAWLCGMVASPSAPMERSGIGFVLHRCDFKPCCNPGHFEIDTLAKNQADAYARHLRLPACGAQHVNAKLSPEQVLSIRSRYGKNGDNQPKLATEFGVSQRCISLVVRGETYRWI